MMASEQGLSPEERTVAVGDVVVAWPELRTPMTVERIDGETAFCAWFHQDQPWSLRRGRFFRDMLIVRGP